jgi:initiation factor 1A
MPKTNKVNKSKHGSRQTNQLLMRDQNEGQEYAEILKAFGNAMFLVRLLNGEEVIGKLKGSMTKGRCFEKVIIGDMVLVMLDSCTTSKSKYYIFHKYSMNEKKQLEKLGELAKIADNNDDKDNIFGFEDDENVKKLTTAEINDDFINDI